MADDAFLRRTFGEPLGTCMLVPQDSPILMIFYVKPFVTPTRLLAAQTIGRMLGDEPQCSPTGQMVIERLPGLMRTGQALSVVEVKYPRRARQRVEEAIAAAVPTQSALLFLAATSELIDGVSWLLGLMQMKPFPQEQEGPGVSH